MSKKPHPVVARWNQLRYALCWKSQVLAPALAALSILESPKLNAIIPTAAIDNRGRLYVNTEWASKLDDGQSNFVILHECLHLVLRHWERRGSRDPYLFNVAADLVINDAIPKLGSLGATRPEKGLFRDVHTPWIAENLSAEEVYERLRANPDKQPKGDKGQVGAGCGVEIVAVDADGDPVDQNGNKIGDDKLAEMGLSPGEWKNIAQTVAQLAKQAGTSGGEALAPLLNIPPSRVQWKALLRDLAAAAVSRAGRDVVSWAKRSRRAPRQIILPGTRTNDVRLAIIIDSSGSMSDSDLAACVAETHAAVNAAGISAYLVVHDHEVRTKAWITPGSGVTDVSKKVVGRGGTLFGGAYAAVAECREKFAAVVHFTDGYPGDAWPAKPANCGRAVCALTPDGLQAGIPDGWRVVPIEIPGRA